MPPIRTTPAAKAVKTERTHEENQERAYIAASRRSDRSLEARVESARRASEIHKRRTGRSLRVTEQDVVNEEMYEEEDDGFPSQYRRLTAHLQTSSTDFNRRLAAYLTNHVAMRTALEQAVSQSYAQHYPKAPNFPHNNQPTYPSPMMYPPYWQGFNPSYQPAPPNPAVPVAGYPHQQPAGRSSSIANPQSAAASHPPTPVLDPSDSRRMSMPAQFTSSAATTPRPVPTQVPTPASIQSPKSEPQHTPSQHPMLPQYGVPYPFGNVDAANDYGPFTPTLPAESQFMLGPAFGPADPYSAMLMGGSAYMQQPSYGFPPPVGTNMKAHSENVTATLAPSDLTLSSASDQAQLSDSSNTESLPTPLHLGLDTSGGDFSVPSKAPPTLGGEQVSMGSGTPGIEKEWTSFIDDHNWEETIS
ncbi:hypothetical protein L228DRAFT_628 [Xylona heveae TC161]|uniref:Uncharacterized protein n=1 Tax=Xylona heveae (strain CBS 132557 / TC161) TaxID=1328760 RepID=A0A165J8A5_XYLHT|nr:hypothetical protein L228DRAFT_628 [Xylona heveae TC161]KZF25883.1 hypothetical protein L228DRAFT_628 [Xylona heveae TC161]